MLIIVVITFAVGILLLYVAPKFVLGTLLVLAITGILPTVWALSLIGLFVLWAFWFVATHRTDGTKRWSPKRNA